VHKQFAKDLQKAKLNPTNSAKMFAYISLIIEEKELPSLARDHNFSCSKCLHLE